MGKSGMRAQAALEYLTTYGWALLVIVLVIAILLLINTPTAPPGCRFDQTGFTCTQPAFASTATNTVLYLNVYNGNNNNVIIYGYNCTSEKTSLAPPLPSSKANGKTVPRQANYSLTANCMKGSAPVGPLPPGTDFTGKFWLFYGNEEDPGNYPIRAASAVIIGKVS